MSFVLEVKGVERIDDFVGDDGSKSLLVILNYAVSLEGIGNCAAEFKVDAGRFSLVVINSVS